MSKELRELLIKNNIDEYLFKNIENVEKLFYDIKSVAFVKEDTFIEYLEMQIGKMKVSNFRDELLIAIGVAKGDFGRVCLTIISGNYNS